MIGEPQAQPNSPARVEGDVESLDRSPIPAAFDGAAVSGSPAAVPMESAPIIHHHEVLTMLQTTLTFLVGALFVLTFIVQPYRIPSGSMENTLLIGDFLLVNKVIFAQPGPWRHLLAYGPVQRDNVVVFHYPVDHSLHLVKRVVGVPGDRIRLHHGRVWIGAQPQNEPFTLYIPSYPDTFRDEFPTPTFTDPGVGTAWWREMRRDTRDKELAIPLHEYFVLGDNRNDSLDSRYWGFLPRQNIVGEPFLVYFSVVTEGRSELTGLGNGLGNDRLAHEHTWWGDLAGFARWTRIFHVIR